ncbi:MAG: hypothetical protein ACR2PM_01630 [Hyphomicrobiales bacterium]
MEASLLIARIIGPLFTLIAVGMLFNRETYGVIMAEFVESRALIYLSGAIALVTGIVIVHFHNLWVADWRVIITVIGWMSLFKGVVRIVYPQAVRKVGKRFIKHAPLMTGSAVVILVLGAFLTVKGLSA